MASSSATISKLTLQVGWGGACGGVSYTKDYFYDIPINNGAFTPTQGVGNSEISGTFTTANNASGTYKAVLNSYHPNSCTRTSTGTWTASNP